MRKYYQRRLPSDPSKDYYYIMRDTGNIETILIEYGFLDSPGDDVNQLKNNNLDYVEAAVKAIAEYAGYTYVPPVGSNLYVVKKGDSLWSIANQFGITVDELINANNLQSNLLNIGQTLTIPQEVEQPSGDFEIYTVQKGDSLYKIANQFDVSIDDIIELNKLGTTSLSINQQLLIPKQGSTTKNTYTVQKGDSLYNIALKNNVTVDELKSINNLTSNVLSIGQTLIIPNGDEITDTDEITYIVKSGDSLWSIAKKYNISVNDLKQVNNLTGNGLSINQKLIIPKTGDYETYVVKSGDSLWAIANANNTTVDEIKKVNNLAGNNLSIGQVLLIP